MKKTLFLSLALGSLAFGATSNEDILKLYSNMPQGMKLEIADRKPVDGLDGFEAITLKISQGDISQKDVMFLNGDFLLPDLVNVKTGESYKNKFAQDMLLTDIGAVYKDETNIIKLGNDPKKETMVIFTDADCPFCRREMAAVNDRLKEVNLELVMVSVHGEKGHQKSALIYRDIKNAKSDSDKIAVFNKYYADTFNIDDKNAPSADETKKAVDLANKYLNAGINSVPFIVDKKDIIK